MHANGLLPWGPGHSPTRPCPMGACFSPTLRTATTKASGIWALPRARGGSCSAHARVRTSRRAWRGVHDINVQHPIGFASSFAGALSDCKPASDNLSATSCEALLLRRWAACCEAAGWWLMLGSAFSENGRALASSDAPGALQPASLRAPVGGRGAPRCALLPLSIPLDTPQQTRQVACSRPVSAILSHHIRSR